MTSSRWLTAPGGIWISKVAYGGGEIENRVFSPNFSNFVSSHLPFFFYPPPLGLYSGLSTNVMGMIHGLRRQLFVNLPFQPE